MIKDDLRGVTYSQFDNTLGPQLLYCYPIDALTQAEFEHLSDYVIVDR